MSGKDPALADQRFHAISVDVYPISLPLRVGLCTEVAVGGGEFDWAATEGIAIGLQRLGHAVVPFVEASAQVGLARLPFWYEGRLEPERSITMLWSMALEVGVDTRLGNIVGSTSVGLQRSSYYFTSGDVEDALRISSGTSLVFKVGVGF